MYHRILVALENGEADESLLPHVTELASRLGSELLLLHVADGWAARHFDNLQLTESEEMKADRNYLEGLASQLRAQGLKASTHLALGDPPAEILKAAEEKQCDLIAMTTHGHRFFGDLLFGSTIHEVRHRTAIPILLVRSTQRPSL
jgi:nucleotide-binding universal stress UspA family protein